MHIFSTALKVLLQVLYTVCGNPFLLTIKLLIEACMSCNTTALTTSQYTHAVTHISYVHAALFRRKVQNRALWSLAVHSSLLFCSLLFVFTQGSLLKNPSSGKCLTVDGGEVVMSSCDLANLSQHWDLSWPMGSREEGGSLTSSITFGSPALFDDNTCISEIWDPVQFDPVLYFFIY